MTNRSGYRDVYQAFNTPLMQQLRQDAYGEDIGQHSWVTAEELAGDIPRLMLSRDSYFFDLGCGPCGPLIFIVKKIGCRATGADFSAEAIAAGQSRAAALDLDGQITIGQADLNEPMLFPAAAFNAVLSLDVILHLRDRPAVFREVARILTPGGRFLFTDAAVITGAVSSDQIQQRSMLGYTQFVPADFNERALIQAGLQLLAQQDRTASLLKNAAGRLAARQAHRAELEKIEGAPNFERQQSYLETVVTLSQSGGLSRIMYLAELPAQ